MAYKIFEYDPQLLPYKRDINLRMRRYHQKREELVGKGGSLRDFANGYQYFGFHRTEDGWVYREWAPAAEEVYLTGDMVGWRWLDLRLTPIGEGVFEIRLPGENALWNGCRVKTVVRHNGELLERIPLYIRRVEQDPTNYRWCGVIVDEPAYVWQNPDPTPSKTPLIYECHIGMAQETETVGTFDEFRERILPRVRDLGYNTLQIMAIMEHPYYGSFGYQVSNFYAVSSRFGTPNGLRALIDAAHGMGISVLLDVVHSHAVRNTAEGINEFDGTTYQFFHEGERGEHPAWGTKLFNYDKNEVIHFLLSNLKYWLEEYHFDGFRFDGVTSMLYHNHGLGVCFTDYSKYFSENTDVEAVTYLQLANKLIREVKPHALTVAEDMSGMPGMCLSISAGGIGFDYRLAMGQPDLWIKLLKKTPDEGWDMWHIWSELTSRRPHEKYVGYAESHDQALVGDKTLIFRMCDDRMYTSMGKGIDDPVIDRGIALHKMIRLAASTMGGEGYLNFMGNEFGHPEWIDFPREGNGWSHFYCRRQWSLADSSFLKYSDLLAFDGAMMTLLRETDVLRKTPHCLFIDQQKQIITFERGGLTFVFNFSPQNSYADHWIPVPRVGAYRVTFSTDESRFGGWDRIAMDTRYRASVHPDGQAKLQIYLPARTALVLKRVR